MTSNKLAFHGGTRNLILSVVALLCTGNAHAADYCYPSGAMCGAVKKTTNNLQTAINNTCNGDVFVNGTPVVPNTRTINGKFIALLSADPMNPCQYDSAATPVISMDAAAADAPLLQVLQASLVIIKGVSLAGGHNQSGNGGTGAGGNLFVDAFSRLFIESASVTGGTADLGGGIYAEDQSSVYLKSASLTGNVAVSPNGVDDGHGGGAYMIDSHLLMDAGSSIEENEADFNGGGLAITRNKGGAPAHMVQNIDGNVSHGGDGGGVHAYDASMCLFREEHNEAVAGNGGGSFFTGASGDEPIYWSLGPTTENHAAGMGGGHYVDLGSLYVSTFGLNANESSESGGGIRATGELTDVFLQRSLVISENLALVDGGGIHADAGARIVLPFEGFPLPGTLGVDLDDYVPDTVILAYSCDDIPYTGPTSIRDNVAGLDGLGVGGGIFLDGATLETDDSFDDQLITLELSRNIAHETGGAVAITGAAEFLAGGAEDVVVATDNEAWGGSGGGFDIIGAGTFAELFRGKIEGNEAASGVGGGASITDGGSLYFESGSISGNTSESGGGIYVGEGDATLGDVECSIPVGELTCVLMDDNLATGSLGGGGIASDGAGSVIARQLLMMRNEADVGAAIVANGAADVHEYTNVVVANNDGGAGVWAVDVLDAGATLTCTHCTIAHNDDNGIQETAGTVTLINSLVTVHPLGSNVGATVDTTDCNKINTTNVREASHPFPGLPFGAGVASVLDECADGDDFDILLNPRPSGLSTSPYEVGAYEAP